MDRRELLKTILGTCTIAFAPAGFSESALAQSPDTHTSTSRAGAVGTYRWALDPRNLNRQDPFAEAYMRERHLRMFDQTWKGLGSTELQKRTSAFLITRFVKHRATRPVISCDR
jgi:hypothetical protein